MINTSLLILYLLVLVYRIALSITSRHKISTFQIKLQANFQFNFFLRQNQTLLFSLKFCNLTLIGYLCIIIKNRAMKKFFSLLLVLASLQYVSALEKTVGSRLVGEVSLTCDKPGDWTFDLGISETDGKEVVTVSMKAPSPQTPPQFTLNIRTPQISAPNIWTVQQYDRCQIKPDWGVNYRSNLATHMPVFTFFNNDNTNTLTIAASECLREINSAIGLREENCMLDARMRYFQKPESPIDSYTTKIILDKRPVFWSDAVREAVDWMTAESGVKPVEAPDAAFDPLYSSWYQFHQNVFAQPIEEECRQAAALGMKTIIVDDGWQTDDNNRGYAYTGDWEVSKNRFPDMAAHVRKVHDTGMKYMLWYSVPFIGRKSKNFDRFKGKYLREDYEKGSLDPRFPEVREFLCNLFENDMKRYGYDGFKLDFIDSFNTDNDPALADNFAGRDIKSIPEAVDRLMSDIYSRLKAINPNVLIEFRQAYTGPAIRQYGNMLRVGDCPGDMHANRMGIAALRLTSGNTAVHADMLEWNPGESPEDAARNILSSIFGVVQYSLMLRDLPENHKRMITHWIDFSQKHRNTLLHSSFRPYNPESGYPIIEAEANDEKIMAVYLVNTVVPAGKVDKPLYILNASGTSGIVADIEGAKKAEIYNLYGKKVNTIKISDGIRRIPIPNSGYALIR